MVRWYDTFFRHVQFFHNYSGVFLDCFMVTSIGQVFHTTEPEGSRAGAEAMTKQSGLGAIAAFMNAEAFRVAVGPSEHVETCGESICLNIIKLNLYIKKSI